MAESNKYYFVKSSFSLSGQREYITKWNERYIIDVHENYEWTPYISVDILKYNEKMERIKNEKYQKVKTVLEELYNDYHNGTLNFLSKWNFPDWEYYITDNTKNWIKIEAYSSEDSTNKGNITLSLSDHIENLHYTISTDKGVSGRRSARNHGTPITYEHFCQFFNISLQYLADHESILIRFEQFRDNFRSLSEGKNDEVKIFDYRADESFTKIIDQLAKRKQEIEKRLIENDQDTKEDRLKLRGELEGINYSLTTINIHK